MYRLLIVDDEARIVNGMYELFSEIQHLDLEIIRTYTVFEALEQSEQGKIDILLTDIKMPGMSGLELSEKILAMWPQCKVIYLSGFNEFDYAQDAIRKGGVDYVLKIESDEKVLEAIDKAVNAIEQELANELFIQQSRKKMHLIYPTLYKAYFLELFYNKEFSLAQRKSKFDELEIPFLAEADIWLILGKVDRWPDELSASDRALYRYSIQNIAQEYLSTKACFVSFDYDHTRFVWLLQPNVTHANSSGFSEEKWQDMMRYTQGMLESIQSTCKKLLNLPISLVVSPERSDWTSIGDQYQSLFMSLSYGTHHGEASIISITKARRGRIQNSELPKRTELNIRLQLKQLDQLEYWLDRSQDNQVHKFISELMNQDQWKIDINQRQHVAMEVFYTFSAFWLTYINQRDMYNDVNASVELNKLTRMDQFQSWTEATEFFLRLADVLKKLAESRKIARTDELIARIHAFINSHIDEELSLTRLGSYVYLNPSYLSRLYKQLTGQGLLEYITAQRIEKAKHLLQYSQLKIVEIVSAVGLESAPYFTRLFKKHTGSTPQEYRDLEQEQVKINQEK